MVSTIALASLSLSLKLYLCVRMHLTGSLVVLESEKKEECGIALVLQYLEVDGDEFVGFEQHLLAFDVS